jgi:hypothetical protein
MKYSKACIVIPIYKSFDSLSNFEYLSLQQVFKVFSGKSIKFICSKDFNFSDYFSVANSFNFKGEVETFDNIYFQSIKGYNYLLMSQHFYERFSNYRYMLIYQLDAYIFRDALNEWVNKGYSYVGAPWIIKRNDEIIFDGVGNGGFSLRHIKTHLKVLESWGNGDFLFLYVRYCFQKGIMPSLFMKWVLFRLRKKYYIIFKEHKGNEDIFWCKIAAGKFSWYTLPNFEEALEFSMETEPRYAFEKNNNQLPFGCHALEKYDLDFWKKWINV